MNIKAIKLQGTTYLAPETFEFAHDSVENYKSYCGAGEGIGDKVVPETMWGKRCSHL